MKNYEITVIIPSYNSEKWIERSLRSIYDQSIDKETYKVILIDLTLGSIADCLKTETR